MNSSYSEPLEEFGVPKSNLWITINLLSPPLKFHSLKHMWDLIGVVKIIKKTGREVITLTVVNNSPGP